MEGRGGEGGGSYYLRLIERRGKERREEVGKSMGRELRLGNRRGGCVERFQAILVV